MLRFTKMQGLGNDFIMLNGVSQKIDLSSLQIKRLADRHLGIGCDQLLLLEACNDDADFSYRIFNSNGSEVEQCGNGARCALKFILKEKLSDKVTLRFKTMKNVIEAILCDDGDVSVEIGEPVFSNKAIPFDGELENQSFQIEASGQKFDATILSMGNPHAVIFTPDVDNIDLDQWGPAISTLPSFPKECNVEFIQILSSDKIKMRVFERHVGETLACGSGACAAVVAGILRKLLHNKVVVQQPGGDLSVTWMGGQASVWMKGPAEFVFEGQTEIV